MNLNKGAMFGLDARIALAIFGALSVISGAALYSAIQESKAVALLSDMNEFSKAVESYFLDTGVYPPSDAATSNLNISGLTENNGVSGWNGPYISYEEALTPTDYVYNHPTYGAISIFRARGHDWPSWSTGNYRCYKASVEPCYVAVMVEGIPMEILRKLEEKVDGVKSTTDEELTGRFRYISTGYAILMGIPYDKSQSFS